MNRRLFFAFLALGIGGLPVAASAQERPAAAPLKVVATFSILADFAREVGGARISLSTFVGPNGDAHVYSPSPADGRRLAEAGAIVVNGLGFEGWLSRLVKSSGAKATPIEAAKGIVPLREAHTGHGHSHGQDLDPHAWHNVQNAKLYVANIRDGLTAADPAGRDFYAANAASYLARLDALETEVRDAVSRIPRDRRKLITTHDAFRYFAAAYGIAFIAPQGVSTEAEASAADVARIIRQVRREGIGAVFLENIADDRLAEQIARETKARIGGKLFSDALSGPDGPAGTYIDLMRHNIRALSAALSS